MRRTAILSRRCRRRWLVRDFPIERFRNYTKVQNSSPPPQMKRECDAYNRIMTYRKWIKQGTEKYLAAWWKVRGYQL